MTSLRRLLIVLGLVLGVVAMAGSRAEAGRHDDGAPPSAIGERTMRDAIASAMAQATPAPAPRGSRTRRLAVRGALIGAAAGAALTIFAASAEGSNEGGGFCGQCMLEWGAIVIPISAGAGAGIGAIVGAALPSRRPGLPVAPQERSIGRRRGVAFAVRF
jgi:hypothetical protein